MSVQDRTGPPGAVLADEKGRAMIDHIGIRVRDFPASRAFYVPALATLGLSVVDEGGDWAMIGHDPEPSKAVIWFGRDEGGVTSPLHFAFAADGRGQVDAFYKAAIAAGGRDNGPPGLRPQYHARYYAAFVIDPDGHNVEAVCHTG